MKCLNCNIITKNPKFCSRTCAATYNNHQRKLIVKKCKICNIEIGTGWQFNKTLCNNCNPNKKDWNKITLEDLQNIRKYQISSRIRNLARHLYLKSDLEKYCINCGYDKHFHICHKIAIKDWPLETTISTINNLSNLIALCPNCHWEFDHGKLKL